MPLQAGGQSDFYSICIAARFVARLVATPGSIRYSSRFSDRRIRSYSSTRFVQIHNNILRRFWGYHSKSRATALRRSENISLLYPSIRTHLVSTCLPALRMMVVCNVLVLYRVSSRNSYFF